MLQANYKVEEFMSYDFLPAIIVGVKKAIAERNPLSWVIGLVNVCEFCGRLIDLEWSAYKAI